MAASASPRPSLPTPSPHTVVTTFTKPQLRRTHIALPTSSTISLLALFAPPNEAKAAVSIAKDQIVSSLTQVIFFDFLAYPLSEIVCSICLSCKESNFNCFIYRLRKRLIRFRKWVRVFLTRHSVLLR